MNSLSPETKNLEFITFWIDNSLIGINILDVKEINPVTEITCVQHAPRYVKGLINLRGQIFTVIDIGVKLGFEERIINEESHILILKNSQIGFIVDQVNDVVAIKRDDLEPVPANLKETMLQFADNIVSLDNEVLITMSVKRLLFESNDAVSFPER